MNDPFGATAEQKKVLRKAMLDVEKVAGDLDNLFKQDLANAVNSESFQFAELISKDKPIADKRLKALAEAHQKAWEFFYFMDNLCGNAQNETAPSPSDNAEIFESPLQKAADEAMRLARMQVDTQKFDVTYHIAYNTQLEVPVGDSLVEAIRHMEAPKVPEGHKEVGFKVEKVCVDGVEIPVETALGN